MVTTAELTVEFPEDRVYNNCKAFLALDHNGHMTLTYIDLNTGDDLVMVYLRKEEIQHIVNLYMANHDLVDNEGAKKDEIPTQTNTPITIQNSP
jgi:hypothetical protein